MSDNTCFRLIISEPWLNVREYLHSFGLLFQVYIPKGSPNIVNVKYEEECSAIQAIAALANEKRVLSIEPLNQWPYVKKTEHSKSSLNSTSDSGDSSVIDIRRLITDALLCRKCGARANYTCWVCGSWYCDEKCQLLDRSDHVMKCIPPLVRGMPGLNELLDRLEMMQKEKRQQEPPQQQQQKAQQQLQQKAQQQQQQQQKQKVPQQQQQKVPPQEQQQQQNVSQQQQQKVLQLNQQQQQQKVPTQQQQQQQALQQALQQQQLQHKDQQQQQLMALQQLQQKAHQQAQQQAKQQHAQLQAQKQCFVDEQLRTGKENGNNTEKHPPTNGANRTVQAKQQPDSLGANIVKPVMQETKQHEQGQMKEQPNGPKQGATQPGSSNRVGEQTVKKQLPEKTDATNVLLNGSGKVAPSPDKSKQQPAQQPAAPKVTNSLPRAISGSFSLQKRMQSLAQASTKRTIEYGPFPAVGSTVTISVVMDKTLYIREVCNDVNDPFTNYIIRCITHASEIEQQLQLPPAEGDIAFAPYDGNFYRAIVKKIEGDNAVVMFPDFGNSLRIQWKLLKEIRDTTIKYATCTTHCVSLFTEEPFSPAVRAFLTDLVEVEPFEVTRVQADASPGETKVELRHLASKYLLSAKVREVANNAPARAKQTEPAAANAKKLVATDPATYKPVFCEELIENYFPDVGDEEVELIIVEASQFNESHFVSVILASNQRSFATVLKECSDYGELDPNDYEGESESEYACLVKFDGTWSRAVKISGDTNDSFFLLDFGIVQRRDKLDRICRFPPALSRQLYCSECMVDNPAILKGWIEKSGNSTFALSGLFVKAKLHVDEDTAILHMKIASITG